MCSPRKNVSILTKGRETSPKMDKDKLVIEICECYVKEEDSNDIENQESEDDASLINETGSIEDALEANSSWNENLIENDDSIYMVQFPSSFCEFNDENEMNDSKLNKSSCSKVEAWLSSNSKKLNKSVTRKENSPQIKEVTVKAKLDTTLSRGVTAEKRKLVFEDHLPAAKKKKLSPKRSWLGSISGWMSDFFG